jgi:hypothetical protein
MPKCPKCGAEIHALIVFERVKNKWIFDGDDYGFVDQILIDVEGFYCPACHELLFGKDEEDEASEFLRGGSCE